MARILSTTPEIEALLRQGSPVAWGVSGGKDSCLLALYGNEQLDLLGHTGPRILIHADLGLVEWKDSGPTCQRLADRLGMELVTVKRAAGGMMERWEKRWENNVARYANLECVKLILPWSTAAMRFCTSELKTDVMCAYLVKRFQNSTIVSASGIRRQESTKRKKAPIYKVQRKLARETCHTTGFDWNAVIEWTKDEVFAYLDEKQFLLHEAYRTFNSSRVSCAFCILGSLDDLKASANCPDNHDIYRRMVDLEICSTFSFHDKVWLADIAPKLLSPKVRTALPWIKRAAEDRKAVEAEIPEHLLYTDGWPTCVPTRDEAVLLCKVRRSVAAVVGLTINFTEPDQLIARYEELMAAKA